MAIKRYISDADSIISNAFKSNLTIRATGSNMGESDTLEIFSVYGQASSTSSEKSRVLVKFPISSISTDRTNGIIPTSGSVSYYLRMFNTEHSFTVPRKFTLAIDAVSRSWDEGMGLNSDSYKDDGICNWTQASSASSGISSWSNAGGDYHTGSYVAGSTLPTYTAYFETGVEDLELNITSLVEEWVAGTENNYGVGIRLTSSIEAAVSSSYTKKFFARGSEFFYKRPIIEARWDDSRKDRRGSFYACNAMLPSDDQKNILYLYNHVRGQLKNIPSIGSGAIYVRMYNSNTGSVLADTSPITGGHVSTGIYSASVVLTTDYTTIYDRWYGSLLSFCYHSGSAITVKTLNASDYNPNPNYVAKSSYVRDEQPRFRVFTREKGWNPNIYTVANSDIETSIVEDMYYKIVRATDNKTVVEYGSGSLNHTRLSYDVSGSYFDFDMELLEADYLYEISFVQKVSSTEYREISDKFRFRVEKY